MKKKEFLIPNIERFEKLKIQISKFKKEQDIINFFSGDTTAKECFFLTKIYAKYTYGLSYKCSWKDYVLSQKFSSD